MNRHKKTINLLMLAIAFNFLPAFAQTEELVESKQTAPSAGMQIREVKDTNVFTGLLRTVWGRLRSFSPNADIDNTSRSRITATMGIRGAETTTTLLQPYWKGDRTNDKAFMEELEAYTAAQLEIDNGNTEQAKVKLDNFLTKYSESVLQPNAVFAKGLLLGGTGQAQQGIDILKGFIQEYDAHPLAEDAKLVIAELSK